MSKNISIDEFAEAIADELAVYQRATVDTVRKTVDEMKKEVTQVVKNAGGYTDRTGSYRRGITSTNTTTRGETSRAYVWAGPVNYRLSHLLEQGHAKKNGGRTRAFPHFEAGDRFLASEFTRQLKKNIEDSK